MKIECYKHDESGKQWGCVMRTTDPTQAQQWLARQEGDAFYVVSDIDGSETPDFLQEQAS